MAEKPPRACPLCSATESRLRFTGKDTVFETPGQWSVVQCLQCTLMFTDPPVAIEDIERYYPDTYAAHAEARPDPRGQRRDPWDRLTPIGRQRLLDIGCGSGGYLARMKSKGWDVTGIEPSSAAVAQAQRAGLNVVQGVLPGASLYESAFDVVVMLGVAGCLPDPRATLDVVRGLLMPGGRLIVSVHNAASAAAERFGPYWQGWDLPRHYNHFTPETLLELLTSTGFRNVRLTGRRRSSRWRHSARAMKRDRSIDLLTAWLAKSRMAASWMSALHGRGMRADELIAEAER